MLRRLAVFRVPLLPLPRRQGPGNIAAGSTLQRLATQGVVLLSLFFTQKLANALLVAGLGHGETFSPPLRTNIRLEEKDG